MEVLCKCPYVICPLHGNCAACMVKNKAEGTLANCMEEIAQKLGARLPLSFPKTYVEEDFEAMSQRSAALLADTAAAKPEAVFSLAAGNTALRTYQILAQWQRSGRADFSKARFIALDEWLDLEDESENCAAFMNKNFYEPAGIRPEQIYFFPVHESALEQECKSLEQRIREQGGIDCMLLGIGMNGHLGLNEPGESFEDYVKIVKLSESTREVGQKYFSQATKLSRGITLGIRSMFDAGRVILQAGGKTKAAIIEKMYMTPPTELIPATVLKLVPHGIVVLDKEAAGRLPLNEIDK